MTIMTTGEAAEALGVSRRQVGRLVGAGVIRARLSDTGILLVDASSVARFSSSPRTKGRKWKAETSWAALFELSGLAAPWMEATAMSRLRVRLRTITAEDLAARVAGRAEARSFMAFSIRDVVSAELLPTGLSVARTTDLVPRAYTEGYLRHGDLEAFIRRHYLVASEAGDVKIHLGAIHELLELEQAPEAVVAADLAKHEHPRESQAGIDLMKDVMRQWQARR